MAISEDEFGVRLSKAAEVYCHPEIYETYRAAGDLIEWNDGDFFAGVPKIEDSLPRFMSRRNAFIEFRTAEKSVISDLLAKIRDGRLVAIGFDGRPSGRDPGAEPCRIRDDVLSANDFRVNWHDETISGNGLTYFGVWLCSNYETPEPPESLIGITLAQCFEWVVIDDWVRQELESVVFKRFLS